MTMHATRRSLFALATAPLLPAAASAQPIAPPSTAPVTISYYNYNLASTGIGAEATKQLLAEFAAEYPHIKVEGVPVDSTQILARVQADLAAGRVPDVAQLVFSDLDFIVKNLGVKPLPEIVPAPEWAAHTAGMVPNGLALGAMFGRVYGLAYVFSTPMLFINADLFRAARLDPAVPPRTWAEVKDAALKIRAATGKHGVYPSIYGGFDWLLQAIFLSNGGRALSQDRKRLMFGEKESIEAIEMFRDMVKTGAHPNMRDQDAVDAMMTGNLGMLLTTAVYTSALQRAAKDKFTLTAAGMPGFGDKTPRPTNSGSALFILARDPVKQRAAWELMKFMTSRRAYTVITSRIGYVPLRLDIVDDPNFLGPWTATNPLIRPNLAQLVRLEPWESFPGANYRQISRIEVAAVNEAVFGEGDPATLLREAQVRAQALMPR
jgi:multiple sugar transport system substrate-binding protein